MLLTVSIARYYAYAEKCCDHSSTVTPSAMRTLQPAALSLRIAAGTLVS